MKFGGSSLESAGAVRQAAAIVGRHLHRQPVVVVSAMGRTTDGLLEAARAAARGNSHSAWQQTDALRRTHYACTRELLGERAEPFWRDSIAPMFRELQVLLVELSEGRPFTPELQDQVLSYGERFSSLIVAEAFRHLSIHAAQVDARKVIVTDRNFTHAAPLYWDTYARLRRTVALVARDRVVVLGGFIAATADGATTTLGRGGSDLTAALVGAGIGAEEIQIWTDVDGMLTCDPGMLAGGYCIREMSYEEAKEMARFGAKVLFPSSLKPALRQRIPIVIRNSRRPAAEGTRIVSAVQASASQVKGIASKAGMAIVHLRVSNQGTLSSITDGLADLFAREHVMVEMIQAQARGISFAVANWPGLPAVLRRVDESVAVTVEEDCAAVWLVGEGAGSTDAVLARASRALGVTGVRLTSQGASSLHVGFAVPERDLRMALGVLHHEFFSAPDPAVFCAPELVSAPAPRALQPGRTSPPAPSGRVAPVH